jgi:hypothetical protein
MGKVITTLSLFVILLIGCRTAFATGLQSYDDSSTHIYSYTVIDYVDSGVTVCLSRNQSNKYIRAYYEVYPVFIKGMPTNITNSVRIHPHREVRVFGNLDSVHVQCTFLHSNYE